MKIEAKLTGDEAIRRKLQRIGEASAFRALAATAEDAETYITAEAAKHHREGRLEKSVYLRRIGPMAFEVGHDLSVARHAVFVHWGTKPHVIKPKDKKALRWPLASGFAFARSVRHPGYKGDPWLVRAAARAPADFERHVHSVLARIST